MKKTYIEDIGTQPYKDKPTHRISWEEFKATHKYFHVKIGNVREAVCVFFLFQSGWRDSRGAPVNTAY